MTGSVILSSNLCPLLVTIFLLAVAAIAEFFASCFSFLFIFSFQFLSAFGGCARLPPTTPGASAARLPCVSRGTRD